MEIEYSEHAANALVKMDSATQVEFFRHIEKMLDMPPRKHLRFGQPYNVEKVGQGRIVYQIEDDTLFITRCFTTHKEYEKWYKSLR
jgi:mRNA-degrading endonuclease RelE of RelBE toxin-antitoxin system